MTLTKALIRMQQLQAVLAALAERPGKTAYTIGLSVPVPQPGPSSGLLAVSAPMTLTLSLLAELEKQGKVRSEAEQRGRRWYLAGETRKGQEAPDDDDDPAARRRPQGST